MVYHLCDAAKKDDRWDDISQEQQKAIDKGIAQLDRGEGIPHKDIMKKYGKWLKK